MCFCQKKLYKFLKKMNDRDKHHKNIAFLLYFIRMIKTFLECLGYIKGLLALLIILEQ